MATAVWLSGAQVVTQSVTWTVGGIYADGQVYRFLCGNKTVSYTSVSGDSNATVAAALYALLTASTVPAEFLDAQYTYATATLAIGFAATTPGVPFTITATASGTGTLTSSAVVASSGPEHYDTAANWSATAVPGNGDTIIFPAGSGPCRYGLDQSSITPATVKVYSQVIGLPDRRGGTTDGYPEYRAKSLAYTGFTTGVVGDPQVTAPTLIRLAVTGAPAHTLTVDTGDAGIAPPVATQPVVMVTTGTGHAHVMRVISGNVGIACNPGEAARYDTLLFGTDAPSGFRGATDADCRVVIGSGATVSGATATVYGGNVDCRAAVATVALKAIRKGDAVWLQRDAAIATVTATGGTLDYRAASTITTATFTGPEAVLDVSGGSGAFAVTTPTVTAGAALVDPEKRIASLAVATDRPSLAASDFGDTFTLTRS